MATTVPEPEHTNAASPQNDLRKQLENSIERLGPADIGCVVVVVPQLELCPFVSALLFEYIQNSGDVLVLLYPEASQSCRSFFDLGDRALHLNIALGNASPDASAEMLLKTLEGRFPRRRYLLHPFALGLNLSLGDLIIRASPPDELMFYADGSRNNLLEWKRDPYRNLLAKATRAEVPVRLFCFGFDSSGEACSSGIKVRDVHIVDYRFVDAAFASVSIRARMVDEAKGLFSPASNALVLARYWGRDPYRFHSVEDMALCYRSSIGEATKAVEGHKIHRHDNRSRASSSEAALRENGLTGLEFSDIVAVSEGDPADCLMETFIVEIPQLLQLFRVIYCFDSSFPLVFQSRRLRALLSDDTEIVVGFDYDMVKQHAHENTTAIMVYRIVGLIQNILRLGLFRVFTRHGPLIGVSSEDSASIEKAFVDASGFFHLRNP